MALDSTKLTIERYNMKVTSDEASIQNSVQNWVLTARDRCDQCAAQAYVQVRGVTGELLFCAHHYNRIMDNAVGYDKMMKFAYQILDERERLKEGTVTV